MARPLIPIRWAIVVAQEQGYTSIKVEPRKLIVEDFNDFDMVISMDKHVDHEIKFRFPNQSSETKIFPIDVSRHLRQKQSDVGYYKARPEDFIVIINEVGCGVDDLLKIFR